MTMTIPQRHYNVKAFPQGHEEENYNYAFGTISSIQNDESGMPSWVLMSHWKSNLLSNHSSVTGEREGNQLLVHYLIHNLRGYDYMEQLYILILLPISF